LQAAVASCESWGVEKITIKSGLITLPRREGKIFCKKILGGGVFLTKIQFLDFEFIHPKEIKLLKNNE